MRLWVFLVCHFLTAFSFGQQGPALEYRNPGSAIQDGVAILIIPAGSDIISWKWSHRFTAPNDSIAEGLDEGVSYRVTLFGSSDSTELEVKVPASSIAEKMNAWFTPLVKGIGVVMYWDLLESLGWRDSRLFDEQGRVITYPNGEPRRQPVRFIVVWLILGAIFFTLYMRFVNIRGFGHSVAVSLGRYDRPEDVGEVTHFQALATALSGTLGLGNIAGVAIAMAIGGPGATVWMIIAGFLGMSSKFVECTLGVKYRNVSTDGEVSGGPMYYLSKGLAKKGWKTAGKILAVLFAILCIGGAIGGGNMFQSNQVMAQVSLTLPGLKDYAWLVGAAMAVMVGLVMLGGIRSIARVTDKLVPLMVGMYLIFSLFIILHHVDQFGEAMSAILNGAFHADALKGGFVGVMMVGFQRAAFSNEAGIGSASIAHSASKTNQPVSEGIISLMEPFIDTVVVCTITALVLVFTGFAQDPQGLTGSQLTNAAFTSEFPWFKWMLLISVFFFAYATILSWGYYGQKSWTYLFGETTASRWVYQTMYLSCTWLGAMVGLGAVMDFSDMMILGMAFPNIIGLIILAPEVKQDMIVYFSDLKNGRIRRHK
jgi:alanine or glycine:cation symporter, AGCS family